MPVILAESGGDGGGSNNNNNTLRPVEHLSVEHHALDCWKSKEPGWFRRELGDRSITEHSLYGLVLCREIIYLIVFLVLGGF